MIARRRAAFLKLCGLLRAIEADLDDLVSVRALNLGVLKEILRDEGHVRRQRGMLKDLRRQLKTERPLKVEAGRLRAAITRCERTIRRYEDQLYVWRCIGDGLAYAYIDSLNLKHAFFDSASPEPKPSAGFISGKSGLAAELGLLLSALDHKVPAVLSDITNSVRYGDLCLLGASDPHFVEVKSRRALNQRGERQAARLAQLEAFLATDFAEGFRGSPHVRRVDLGLTPRDRVEDFNLCLRSARADGYNLVCPERGLVYVATVPGARFDDVENKFPMTAPIVFQPNLELVTHNWAPYRPLTNSIRDLGDLYEVMVGNLHLVVIVDAAVICDRVAQPGWRVSMLDHRDASMLIEHGASGGKVVISRQLFGRLGYEFMSLDSFVDHAKQSVAEMLAAMEAGDGVQVEIQPWEELLDATPRFYSRVAEE